jgi:hypothetical protein
MFLQNVEQIWSLKSLSSIVAIWWQILQNVKATGRQTRQQVRFEKFWLKVTEHLWVFLEFSQNIAKDVSFKMVFGFVLILDILIIRSNSHKRFRNILQSSKKSPYQRNDEINKNFRTRFSWIILTLFYCLSILQLYHIVHALANIWWKFGENFERAVAIFHKTSKRVSCNLK